MATTDLVRELRLRKWAREHFVQAEFRKPTWHPVVLDEMHLRDLEQQSPQIQETVSADRELIVKSVLVEEQPLLGASVFSTPDFAMEFEGTNLGSNIVPLIPDRHWMLHQPSTELQGPHWHLASQGTIPSQDQLEAVGYF